MKKILPRSYAFFIIALFGLIITTQQGQAYELYSNPFPPIGPTQYLGDIMFSENDPVSIYIADDDTINTMIYYRYYKDTDKKWTVKVLLVPLTERVRQAFVKELNSGANNDTWLINKRLSLPVNNRVWALREDVSYYPNSKTVNVRGAWIYNDYGEMIGFDIKRSQETAAFYYGEKKDYDTICDLVSKLMAERYQEAVANSQNFAR
ncbi:hypothetical protein [Sporomusa aerivorans]|uniref:hypothetical protein n=1 Tax=Sporomusa aerivorans TaxID=204936 RepID=UPI003529E04B